MEKIYACTIRPMDCKYYTKQQCGNDNSKNVCEYAKEIIPAITADEIEPDMIDREILANMRRRAALEKQAFIFNGGKSEEQQGFMYDPTVKDEVQEEGQRIVKLFEYVLNQEKEKKQKSEIIDMNTNHEFPNHIAKVLDALKFEKKELRYYGKPNNYKVKDAIIEFGIDGDSLMCRDVTSMKPIFIVDSAIGLGYFLVLLQAYGIYHKRYVYERVDGILEQFIYDQED
jgi:hypothetical protein